jgi:hypothetical protein
MKLATRSCLEENSGIANTKARSKSYNFCDLKEKPMNPNSTHGRAPVTCMQFICSFMLAVIQ